MHKNKKIDLAHNEAGNYKLVSSIYMYMTPKTQKLWIDHCWIWVNLFLLFFFHGGTYAQWFCDLRRWQVVSLSLANNNNIKFLYKSFSFGAKMCQANYSMPIVLEQNWESGPLLTKPRFPLTLNMWDRFPSNWCRL